MSAFGSSCPYFQLEFAMAVDQFEIGAVGSDEACAMRSRSQGNKHIEMQVAQFLRVKSAVRADLRQQLSRLQPIPCGRRKNGMIALQGAEKFPFCRFAGTAPQLGQHDRRCPHEAARSEEHTSELQ